MGFSRGLNGFKLKSSLKPVSANHPSPYGSYILGIQTIKMKNVYDKKENKE